ncbi:antibiotic biosynthesis monooxygenase [Aromatoleum diolicum]|uniref:Antibiotic biosynthesis monooxygenase n=2 Tax=Aromatoleum diolicum TaxID=75796 RepID=A0ABX1Q9F0_9RHOO|nr:antibiotic biosynthesis monooxygenase [Aromatoleum diolicum]
MMEKNVPVSRVVRRKAKLGHEKAYEALLKSMVEASSHFPGYLSATVIPPHTHADQGEYQIVQRFATPEDLARWDESDERAMWHERIRPVAESAPAYRLVPGLKVWFSSQLPHATTAPPRWKMTTVNWLGIFPTVAICLGLISPFLATWPFLARTALITAMVAALMSYAIMPRLSRWMGWWLKR